MFKKIRRISLFIFVIVAVFLLSLFLNNFVVSEGFTPVPLSYDSYTNTSTYTYNKIGIKMINGFVKGKIKDEKKRENIILRSLAPNSKIELNNNNSKTLSLYIQIENVDSSNIKVNNVDNKLVKVIDTHTIQLSLTLNPNEKTDIDLTPINTNENQSFVILGDNRNGYNTFSKIIDQINYIKPLFVIDNGDLVYGGEANKYRLFYQTVDNLNVPLYTTLGNHDIRENGRGKYTELFGPSYYSFDYSNYHFTFLDSSRGWFEKQAIPDSEYAWLENDLKQAQGKTIFVISHIPATDPRKNVNQTVLYQQPETKETGYLEKLLTKFSENSPFDHGFSTQKEANRFEDIMTKYNVNTVFYSHIHSYYDYNINNVRYIISGGAGAELLTEGSYYHYLKVSLTNKDNYIEMVQLPSPSNTLVSRYLAALSLFTKSIIKEYKTVVISMSILFGLLITWFIYANREKIWKTLQFVGTWFRDIIKFAIDDFKKKKRK